MLHSSKCLVVEFGEEKGGFPILIKKKRKRKKRGINVPGFFFQAKEEAFATLVAERHLRNCQMCLSLVHGKESQSEREAPPLNFG